MPFWIGVLPGGALVGATHILMLPAMWLVMVRRGAECLLDHDAHAVDLAGMR